MNDMKNQEEYLKDFPDQKGTRSENSKREEALKAALDIRKFEIDNYWKRAAYFWVFITLAFTAYFAVATNGKKLIGMENELLLLSAGAGLFMSLCWYCVCKGSKYWQANWEKHVDWLEDAVMGPLYKRVLAYGHGMTSRICPTRPYPFSVSKVNQLLAFVICFIWAFLYASTLRKMICNELYILPCVITVILGVLIYILFKYCKTGCYQESDSNDDKMHVRGDENKENEMGNEKIFHEKNETLRIVGMYSFLFYVVACGVFVFTMKEKTSNCAVFILLGVGLLFAIGLGVFAKFIIFRKEDNETKADQKEQTS